MTLTIRSLALAIGAMLFAFGSTAPASAATNQAVLTVNATVTNNCDVLTQPATLTMSYNPVTNSPTLGTSSFTYACTNGASVSVTQASPNFYGNGTAWEAKNGANILVYDLNNNLTCAGSELTNGGTESLGSGTGSSQTYNICAVPVTNTGVLAGTYVDTITWTFNFGP